MEMSIIVGFRQRTWTTIHCKNKAFLRTGKNKIEMQLYIEKYKIIDSPSNEETYLVILTQ
jgi:hypothetical protein